MNPYCPVCQTPLTLSIKNLMYRIDPINNSIPPPPPVPHCLRCDDIITLYDDDGDRLTLSEAKQLLSPIKRKEIVPPKPDPPKPQTTASSQAPKPDVYEPDETDKKIIGYLYRDNVDPYLNKIAEAAGLDVRQTRMRLNTLIAAEYVRRPKPLRIGDLFESYVLSDKGIKCANSPDYKGIPHPGGEVELDDTSIEILNLLADQNFKPFAEEIANALNLHIQRVKLYLGRLEKQKYIYSVYVGLPRERPGYFLADKGREELMRRDKI